MNCPYCGGVLRSGLMWGEDNYRRALLETETIIVCSACRKEWKQEGDA